MIYCQDNDHLTCKNLSPRVLDLCFWFCMVSIHGSKMIVIGGKSVSLREKSVINQVEIYDVETDSWNLQDQLLNEGRFGASGCLQGNNIYVISGMNIKRERLRSIEKLDIVKNS